MGNPRYFFHDGLRFECIRCGTCCTGEPGIVAVDTSEADAIARYLGRPLTQLRPSPFVPARQGYSIREHRDGRCHFYCQGCTIYEVRPRQCRTYPFWASNLRSTYRWRRVARECPGIGTGRFYSQDEILTILQREFSDQEDF